MRIKTEKRIFFPTKAAEQKCNVGLQDGGAGTKGTALGGLTEVIGAGSSLGDVDECCPSWDVQDLVVTVGNGDISEASRHLPAGGFLPATKPTFVNDGTGA